MQHDIAIPTLGDSVPTATILEWRFADGAAVKRDDIVCVLETDKINMELSAPAAGVLRQIAKVGQTVKVGDVVAKVDESAVPTAAAPATVGPAKAPSSAPVAAANGQSAAQAASAADVRSTPLARKAAEEHGINLSALKGSGLGGRVVEQDVESAVKARGTGHAAPAAAGTPAAKTVATSGGVRRERMSALRQRVAQRLVEAQHTAAMLTTFNEVDMSAVMDLRKKYKESFEKKHGIGLGFMSFFVKACANALRAFPNVNASIVQSAAGEMEVEHHDSQDIAVAVSTPKGLVVPVLRNCAGLSFAEVELGIKDLATRARDGKLSLADMQSGTFTITNGGVFGSLMSTPILNPPQTGILGMHTIKNRPIEYPTGSGQIALRPMMYLALSYDHRLIDGSDAVQFLVSVKQAIEEPERLLIGM
jgi:2-oxoglutarate dehydrogenase E2 component (dihydrolipoamide succinyltransferase)